MATQLATRTFETSVDLPAEARAKVVRILNQHLADSFDLLSQVKQAHWNVKGPDFWQLHKLFDEVAARGAEWVDEFAERVTALTGGRARRGGRGTRGTGRSPRRPRRTRPRGRPASPRRLVRGLAGVRLLETGGPTPSELIALRPTSAAKPGDAPAAVPPRAPSDEVARMVRRETDAREPDEGDPDGHRDHQERAQDERPPGPPSPDRDDAEDRQRLEDVSGRVAVDHARDVRVRP